MHVSVYSRTNYMGIQHVLPLPSLFFIYCSFILQRSFACALPQRKSCHANGCRLHSLNQPLCTPATSTQPGSWSLHHYSAYVQQRATCGETCIRKTHVGYYSFEVKRTSGEGSTYALGEHVKLEIQATANGNIVPATFSTKACFSPTPLFHHSSSF